jgi:hypothetical protein
MSLASEKQQFRMSNVQIFFDAEAGLTPNYRWLVAVKANLLWDSPASA